MDNQIRSIASEAAALTLAIAAGRWVISTRGNESPIIRGDSTIYRMRWKMRLAGFVCAPIFVFVMILLYVTHDRTWVEMVPLTGISFWLFWEGMGAVTKDQHGIAVKYPGRVRFVSWPDITAITTGKSGAIVIHSKEKRLVISPNFVATPQLLHELQDTTGLTAGWVTKHKHT